MIKNKKNMLIFILVGLTITMIVICFLCRNVVSKDIQNAIISEDYSKITYNNKIYTSFVVKDINDLPNFNMNKRIYANVENSSFISSFLFTDYIYVSEKEEYLYLITDYDLRKSDYYKCELNE